MAEPNFTDGIGLMARKRPGAAAVHLPGGPLSFLQLDGLVWRLATLLHDRGVKPGNVVVLIFSNELLTLVAMLATARIGATVFSVPRGNPPLQKSDLISRAGADVIVSNGDDPADSTLPLIRIDGSVLRSRELRIDPDVRDAHPDAPWLIIAGSGSTGTPKLIPLHHGVFLRRVALFDSAIPLSGDDCVASLINLDFQVAKIQYIHALLAGAPILLFSLFGRGDLVTLCRSLGVSVLYTAVIHLQQLVERAAGQTGPVFGFLRALVAGGSTVSDDLRRRIAAQLSDRLYVRYGTNETGPISDAFPPDVFQVSGSVGRPYRGVDLEVIGPDGKPVSPGETGLVRVSSPGLAREYIGDPEATRAALGGKWFLPGDLGRLTAGGQLVYCGRADHMMIMNGINIYPAEIETVICGHPAVLDAAVMPVHSELHQDVPVCAVQLAEDTEVNIADLKKYCVERLGARAPKGIVPVTRVPRTEHGKLIRSELAPLLSAGLGLKGTDK